MDMISALAGIEEGMLQSGLGQLVVDELLYQRGAARDVRPGESWAFSEHRTMAEIIADETAA
jgi:hypothetical protein